jgi:hypothetical protein
VRRNISKRIFGPAPLVLQNIYPGRYLFCCKRSYPLTNKSKREEFFVFQTPVSRSAQSKYSKMCSSTWLSTGSRTPFPPISSLSLSFPFQQPRHDAMQAPFIFPLTPLPLYRRNGITVPSHRPTTLAQSSVTKPLPWIPERETCIVAQLCRRERWRCSDPGRGTTCLAKCLCLEMN